MVVEAHCPGFGVKVYVVVAVLFNAGDQVPTIPLLEVVGKGLKISPEQACEFILKIGVVGVVIILMVIVVVLAHCPAFGVKV